MPSPYSPFSLTAFCSFVLVLIMSTFHLSPCEGIVKNLVELLKVVLTDSAQSIQAQQGR